MDKNLARHINHINPFVNSTTHLRPWVKLRCVITGCMLVPPRACMMVTSVLAAYATAKVCTLGVSKKTLKTIPLQGWRRSLRDALIPRLNRVFLYSLGFHHIIVTGKPATRSEAPILVSNHIAPWEALFLYSRHSASFVSGAANFSIPFIGTCLYAVQCVYVDRHSEESRHSVESEIRKRASDVNWPQVGVFPEGTTTNGSSLIGFRNGAFSPGLPVQPIVVRYHFDCYNGIDPCWCGFDVGLGWLTLRLMSQVANTMEVRYLDVITPNPSEIANSALFASRTREAMSEALGVPMTTHSLEDLMLQFEAKKLKLDPDQALLGMETAKDILNVNVTDVKNIMHKFAEFDVDRDGQFTYKDFLHVLGIPASPIMDDVWKTFSKGRDWITLNQYILVSIEIANERGSPEMITRAFELLDEDADHRASIEELHEALRKVSPNVSRSTVEKTFKTFNLRRDELIDIFEFAQVLREKPAYLEIFAQLLKRHGDRAPHCKMPDWKPVDF